ncbi:class I SAM-dependent methyltransferase [Herbaspirillum lusitanum]|uniref:class I SAM-dependent methyltransferase n=1 Tax=Herbaspirillum lusitanum TaxID=213312 RepID=UPI0003682A38|nr:class I SAM-dependent methyltransferase [Herbaspirillum lusitanum]
MAQITSGIRSILSHPAIYSTFQNIMGVHAVRAALVSAAIRPEPGMHILDIGCGPAEILEYLPGSRYWGFDISEPYIEQARTRFNEHGHFYCKMFTPDDLEYLPKFDVVLAIGLLHHLDDETARSLLKLTKAALKSGGRLVTLDPCIHAGQNPIARFLISLDRGQNVRNEVQYRQLVSGIYSNCSVEIRQKPGIPYTHCIMECRN